jgi:hypothetical protein
VGQWWCCLLQGPAPSCIAIISMYDDEVYVNFTYMVRHAGAPAASAVVSSSACIVAVLLSRGGEGMHGRYVLMTYLAFLPFPPLAPFPPLVLFPPLPLPLPLPVCFVCCAAGFSSSPSSLLSTAFFFFGWVLSCLSVSEMACFRVDLFEAVETTGVVRQSPLRVVVGIGLCWFLLRLRWGCNVVAMNID